MPRQQSTAAKNARRAQAAQGGKYTTHLRTYDESATDRLIRALDEVGLNEQAALLRDATAPDPEFDRAERAYQSAYMRASAADLAGQKGPRVEALWQVVEKTQAAMWALCSNDPFHVDRLRIQAVHASLNHVIVTDPASPCLRPAADVLDAFDPECAADVIRGARPLTEPRDPDAPITPVVSAAYQASKALAAASRVPFAGDEAWTKCSALIRRAAVFAKTAAGIQTYPAASTTTIPPSAM